MWGCEVSLVSLANAGSDASLVDDLWKVLGLTRSRLHKAMKMRNDSAISKGCQRDIGTDGVHHMCLGFMCTFA